MEEICLSNEVRTLVLVGRSGNGKSATGNSILGRKAFTSRAGSSTVTRISELQKNIIKDGTMVNVINTPGLFDGSDSGRKEMMKCIDLGSEGIHAFVVVFSVRTRFSEEEQTTLRILQTLLGPKIVEYMIVVFTGGDELEDNEETLDDYLGQECPQPLQDILVQCDNRKVLFDNKTKDEMKQQRQVEQLLSLVNVVISQNHGQPYTNEIFVKSQYLAHVAKSSGLGGNALSYFPIHTVASITESTSEKEIYHILREFYSSNRHANEFGLKSTKMKDGGDSTMNHHENSYDVLELFFALYIASLL
ncbi:unnamed protein product [Sphenostylis stenocarpa]|uniref:AIG1-type G domain-containing protein n=1 Tax=Sphenostylis stenocarpa TaxID=92480 RepID=A0AA86T191_9FABA|nr:unnamed protein product [Sphenostylis stenocarpa]